MMNFDFIFLSLFKLYFKYVKTTFKFFSQMSSIQTNTYRLPI